MVRDRSRQQCQNLHGAASSVATKQQLCSAEPVGHRGCSWLSVAGCGDCEEGRDAQKSTLQSVGTAQGGVHAAGCGRLPNAAARLSIVGSVPPPTSGLGIHWMWIGLVFVCAPWMLFCVWLPWIPQCRWIHKRKMPKRSALILTAMLAAFCLLALAVMVMFAVDAATSVDVGCHG